MLLIFTTTVEPAATATLMSTDIVLTTVLLALQGLLTPLTVTVTFAQEFAGSVNPDGNVTAMTLSRSVIDMSVLYVNV